MLRWTKLIIRKVGEYNENRKRPARILLYEQVVEDLCLLIDRGDFEPGDQLPSERELIEKLNVSRNVLREAFHVLEAVVLSYHIRERDVF